MKRTLSSVPDGSVAPRFQPGVPSLLATPGAMVTNSSSTLKFRYTLGDTLILPVTLLNPTEKGVP